MIKRSEKLIDLHVHSNVSDGTLSPSDLVKHAVDIGVGIMALTDHDTTDGVNEALEAAKGMDITVIPGIEISAGFKEKDIHILGYFMDYESENFQNTLRKAWEKREERNLKIVEKFKQFGITLDLEGIRKMSGSAVITRAHFARWLVDNGYCKSNSEVFDKYLGNNGPCFVPRDYMSKEIAISIIGESGGIPVLAHPMLYGLNFNELESLVKELKSIGLKGIETYYSSNMGYDEELVRSLALRYDLVMTGGSDFHGTNKPGLEIGVGRSDTLRVPKKTAQDLFAMKGIPFPENM